MIIFPASFLLVQIFRRSRVQITRFARLKKLFQKIERKRTALFGTQKPQHEASNQKEINGFSDFNPDMVKKRKPFLLPWWFKIVGYALSFIFVGVSAFFIIVQGITFGEEKVSRWLTSFVTSVIASIFLTQPLQV